MATREELRQRFIDEGYSASEAAAIADAIVQRSIESGESTEDLVRQVDENRSTLPETNVASEIANFLFDRGTPLDELVAEAELAAEGTAGLSPEEQQLLEVAQAGNQQAILQIESGIDVSPELQTAWQREAQEQARTEARDTLIAQFGGQISENDLDQIIEIYNSNPGVTQKINEGDYEAALMASQTTQFQQALDQSTFGRLGDFTSIQYGVGKWYHADQQEMQAWADLNPEQLSIAALGKTKYNQETTTAAAVAGLFNTAQSEVSNLQEISSVEAEISQISAQLQELVGTSSTDALLTARSGMPQFRPFNDPKVRELAEQKKALEDTLGRLNAQQQMRDLYRTIGAHYMHDQLARFEQEYNGSLQVALIATMDKELADKIYEGGGYNLTSEERKRVREIIDDSGGRWMPGTTAEQQNALLYGSPAGSQGRTISYTVPDDSSLRESYRSLYQSWFLDDPTDDALDAFVADMQGQVRAEALKQARGVSRPNVFKNPGPVGDIVIEQEDVDYQRQVREQLRDNPQYQDLFGKRPEGVSEEQYAGVFRNTAAGMLGNEGVLATDAIRQGMRSGETAATARLSMYDRRFRDNGTLIGKMANAASTFARFT